MKALLLLLLFPFAGLAQAPIPAKQIGGAPAANLLLASGTNGHGQWITTPFDSLHIEGTNVYWFADGVGHFSGSINNYFNSDLRALADRAHSMAGHALSVDSIAEFSYGFRNDYGRPLFLRHSTALGTLEFAGISDDGLREETRMGISGEESKAFIYTKSLDGANHSNLEIVGGNASLSSLTRLSGQTYPHVSALSLTGYSAEMQAWLPAQANRAHRFVVTGDSIHLGAGGYNFDLRVRDLPLTSNSSYQYLVQDPLTRRVYRSNVGSGAGGGSTPLRFGVSGEDGMATEDRMFGAAGHGFHIYEASRLILNAANSNVNNSIDLTDDGGNGQGVSMRSNQTQILVDGVEKRIELNAVRGMLLPQAPDDTLNNMVNPMEGTLLYATGQHKPYYHNGTSWMELGAGGSSAIPTLQQVLGAGNTSNNSIILGSASSINSGVINLTGGGNNVTIRPAGSGNTYTAYMPEGKTGNQTYAMLSDILSGGGGGGSSQWTDGVGNIHYIAGKVGIGTSTPGAVLSVEGEGDFTHSLFSIRNSVGSGVSNKYASIDMFGGTSIDGSTKFQFGQRANGHVFLYNNAEGDMDFATNAKSRFTILGNGKLQIKESSTSGSPTGKIANISYATNYYGRLNFAVDPHDGGSNNATFNRSEVRYVSKGATNGNGQIYFAIASSEANDQGPNLLMGIASGRTFITSVPDYTQTGDLHLGGESYVVDAPVIIKSDGRLNLGTNGGETSSQLNVSTNKTFGAVFTQQQDFGSAGIKFQPNTGSSGLEIGIYNGSAAKPNHAFVYQALQQPLSFYTNALERIHIEGDGKVGIGTSTPATLLHVAGATTYSTTAEPADPASGFAVEWFDGTNKKAKKNVNGTITTIVLY